MKNLAYLAVIIACIVWITATIANFQHRVKMMENQQREIKKEIDQRFDRVDESLEKIDDELFELQLMFKTSRYKGG